MLILALDTTTRAGSTAVLRDDEVVALVPGDAARTHAERLPAELQDALAIAGVGPGDLDLLAVASGPGAFTGLRIGLAAVQGLAMTLGKPAIGVSALDALALSVVNSLGTHTSIDSSIPWHLGTSSFIGCWMDARRGEVFTALYSGALDELDPAAVAAPDATLERWRTAVATAGPHQFLATGDGAQRYADLLEAAGILVVAAPDLAPFIGRIAHQRAVLGQGGPPHALAPLYVRRPDVEIERERKGPA